MEKSKGNQSNEQAPKGTEASNPSNTDKKKTTMIFVQNLPTDATNEEV